MTARTTRYAPSHHLNGCVRTAAAQIGGRNKAQCRETLGLVWKRTNGGLYLLHSPCQGEYSRYYGPCQCASKEAAQIVGICATDGCYIMSTYKHSVAYIVVAHQPPPTCRPPQWRHNRHELSYSPYGRPDAGRRPRTH